jgi:formate dehydrogenase major subunit
VKAMIIGNAVAGRFDVLDPALLAALPKLEFLVVTDFYADTPLGKFAHVVLPLSMSMEKDGTYTSFDRTTQRLRAAVPPMGEAKDAIEIFSRIARRMGYGMDYRGPARVADEIAKLVPGYGGITYARLERHGVHVPVTSYIDGGTPILSPSAEGAAQLKPSLVPAGSLS